MRMKCCPRCVGDMFHEISRENAAWVCIQCKHRLAARADRFSPYVPRDLRFDQAIDRDLSGTPQAAVTVGRSLS